MGINLGDLLTLRIENKCEIYIFKMSYGESWEKVYFHNESECVTETEVDGYMQRSKPLPCMQYEGSWVYKLLEWINDWK